jgi:Lhr-like helicase
VVLDILTNKPSIALAEKRDLVPQGILARLPPRLRLQWARRAIAFSVVTGDDTELQLNRFQRQLWDDAQSVQILSVSAPTSTGKSFALYRLISEFIRVTPKALVTYLVPTRALIQQVEIDLREHFRRVGLGQTNVSSMPLAASLKPALTNVFVFTQERMHIFLNSLAPSHNLSMLVVDEAQKVGDGARGVLLQNVIDAILARSTTTRALFASPMTSNPELLLEGHMRGTTTKVLTSGHVTVNQNLLWASQKNRDSRIWSVEVCLDDSMVPLGQITLPFRPTSESKRLTFVAHAMADPAGGNLVYVNGPAEAEKAAHQLWDLRREAEGGAPAEELVDLRELVRRVIHPDYTLAQPLNRGVAFHYGNMPLVIRTDVERLFKAGFIRHLICTSTLIEGVNLPGQSHLNCLES